MKTKALAAAVRTHIVAIELLLHVPAGEGQHHHLVEVESSSMFLQGRTSTTCPPNCNSCQPCPSCNLLTGRKRHPSPLRNSYTSRSRQPGPLYIALQAEAVGQVLRKVLGQAEAGRHVLHAVFGQAEAVGQVSTVLGQAEAVSQVLCTMFLGNHQLHHQFIIFLCALIIQLFILFFTDILLIFRIQLYFLHFFNSNRINLFHMRGREAL